MKALIKFTKWLILSILSLVVLASIILIISGNSFLIKAVRSTYLVGESGPTILDYTKFENRTVEVGKGRELFLNPTSSLVPDTLLRQVEEWETVALLVLKKDTILLEKYWESFTDSSYSNSFSMAKSFVSIAIGVAIREGKIKNVDQKVADFLPEFSVEGKKEITIKDLLTMSSGIDFGESYSDPFGYMTKTYYGSSLYDITMDKPLIHRPGQLWKYQGGNTLLLSFVIEAATGQSLSAYFSEKVWKEIGASYPALWSISEKEKKEKAYCCFYSNARDFAKIGMLYLDSGKVLGKRILDSSYFFESIQPVNILSETNQIVDYYGYQWWLGSYKNISFFYARGILGQYIVVIPSKELVLVRLGHKRDANRGARIPKDLFLYLDIALGL